MSQKIRVILKRSQIGRPETQRKVLRALGLRKMNQERILPDAPWVRGMVEKVGHLIRVEEVKE